MAGEWQLQLAEDFYAATWEPYQLKTAARSLAEAKAQAAQLDRLKTQVEDKYLALDPYGVVEYSMAAKVRFGDVQYGGGAEDRRCPDPGAVARSNNDEVIGAYETQRDANLKKKLDEAKLSGRGLRSRQEGRHLQPVEPQGAREPRSRIPGRIHSVAPGDHPRDRRTRRRHRFLPAILPAIPIHRRSAAKVPRSWSDDPPRGRRHRAVRRRVLRCNDKKATTTPTRSSPPAISSR